MWHCCDLLMSNGCLRHFKVSHLCSACFMITHAKRLTLTLLWPKFSLVMQTFGRDPHCCEVRYSHCVLWSSFTKTSSVLSDISVVFAVVTPLRELHSIVVLPSYFLCTLCSILTSAMTSVFGHFFTYVYKIFNFICKYFLIKILQNLLNVLKNNTALFLSSCISNLAIVLQLFASLLLLLATIMLPLAFSSLLLLLAFS